MKKALVFSLVLFVGVTILLFGCAKVVDTTSSSRLPAGVAVGSPISSPEATITGAVATSGGAVRLNLGGIIPTGASSSVSIDLSRMSVYAAAGSHASGLSASDTASWTALSTGFYSGSASPIDVVFVLDNTGSMGEEITAVKNSIVAFATTLEAAGVDAKFALVTYGDSALHPTPAGFITSESFTDASFIRPILDLSTAARLQATLESVTADGGSDTPENPFDCTKWALHTNDTTGALDNLTWRAGAQKIFVIITDASAHQNIAADTSSDNKCTTTATLEVARMRNFNAKVYAVSPNYTSSLSPYADVRMLADGFGEGRTTAEAVTYTSGGQWIRLPSDGNVDLTELGISDTLTAGRTINLSGYTFANGTVYTLIVYYDVTGDGILDSYAYFVFTYSSTAGALGIQGKLVPIDDHRPSYN
ncbi:VWA domain-containing protein [Candidatus Saganbacteria bacterium]|nr:VWA domain-containing protein [Candidatus Saganbacteria bacterium]